MLWGIINRHTGPVVLGFRHIATESQFTYLRNYSVKKLKICINFCYIFFFFFFFFFFLWLYNSLCRVLAFSSNSFHLLLSWTRVLKFGTFDFCISFLTSSYQRVFGLPVCLLEMGVQEYSALTILVSCILSMWPSHPSLRALMKFIIFLCFITLSNSWLVFIRQIPFSFVGPNIFLKTFLSKDSLCYRSERSRVTTMKWMNLKGFHSL